MFLNHILLHISFNLSTNFTDCGLSAYRVPRFSPLKPVADRLLLQLIESGLLATFVEQYDRYLKSMFGQIISPTDDTHTPLTMSQLIGVFWILIAGGFCGSLIFILELLNFNCFNRE